jgi:hypothetical protein
VLRQDAVDRRAEPHQPSAQRERIDAKGLHEIVGSRFWVYGQERNSSFINQLKFIASEAKQSPAGCANPMGIASSLRSSQ